MKAKALSPGRKQEEPLLTNILSVERQRRNDDDALGDYDDDADNGDDDYDDDVGDDDDYNDDYNDADKVDDD